MSDRVRSLVWDYYDQKRFRVPRILLLALSDEADDRGGGIFQSVDALAKKTEQSRRAVVYQIGRLKASGLLECVDPSKGGPGQFSHYRLNLALLVAASNSAPDARLTVHQMHGLDPSNSAPGARFPASSNTKNLKETVDAVVAPCTVAEDADDLKAAAWMLERIRRLNPEHAEPNLKRWARDIRLMRERDGRSRRQICELFLWANSDGFWQANILSPGTLREKWDTLLLHRRRDQGANAAATEPKDKRCTREVGGVRCQRDGVFGKPDGSRRCRECQHEEEEHERAGA